MSCLRSACFVPLCAVTAVVIGVVGAAGANTESLTEAAPVSFELDVQPILTATGCNAGACHGKQRGQNGFQLSLLGFDSEFDHAALTRGGRGRRLFPGAPKQSLLLRKATAELPHGGGRRLTLDSPAYRTLLRWIEQGAPRRVEGEPQLTEVVLAQTDFSLLPGQHQQLQVTARLSDGSTRDVTRLTAYASNDESIVGVDDNGQIQAGQLPGETAVMARYMNQICVANVIIPRTDPLPAETFRELPAHNYIDEFVYAKLAKLSIQPSEEASDSVFLRRVYQDLIGQLPSAEEARRFLSSDNPDRRELLIDELLQRPEYADHWAGYWADLLRPNPYRVGIKAVLNYDNWIRQQFRDDVSYDTFVRRLVTAKGSTWHHGATTLFRDRRSPDEVATMVSRLFLGVRLECAKCHHHPFERWSQRDFYQFAAYFAKVSRKGTGLSPPISGGQEFVFSADKGSVQHPLTGETLAPVPLFGESREIGDSDPREALVDWMLSAGSDYFAQVQANRVWAALMGRGLVEPVDDLRSTNPPTNPELLDALASDFRESGYDLKHLLKTIAMSRVYRLSSVPTESNAADRINYSRHYRHRLRAEVLMDAITKVTGTDTSFSAMPPASRASQVWTTRVDSMFLDTFGRPDENQDPPCERTPESTVTQALHLMNSVKLDGRVRSDKGWVAQLAASDRPAEALIEEIYLAAFSRFPREPELKYASGLFEATDNRRQLTEDLMWAMINSPEFSIQD